MGVFLTNREGAVAERESDSEHDYSRYESMRIEEVNEELRNFGIDPRPTIDAVKELVRQNLADRHREKS